MKTARSYYFNAWKKLILAYLLSALVGFSVGMLLVKWTSIPPERIYEASTKRLSYAVPVFEHGMRKGADLGALLFVWNVLGALATLSFVYTASLFNPEHCQTPPRWLRRLFCGNARMKLLCYLPGCARIEAESLRRVYVWMMVPLLGFILLGLESGLQVAMITVRLGSFLRAVISLLPHGLIEIPTFALAGAAAYSAHLYIGADVQGSPPGAVFRQIAFHRRSLPMRVIAASVIGGLLIAGLIEGHVTPRLMQML